MTKPPKAEGETPADDLYEIELDRVGRDFDPDFGTESYEVEFNCTGPHGSATATVEMPVDTVTTTEIVPMAMGIMHRLFAALARQTEAWGKKP